MRGMTQKPCHGCGSTEPHGTDKLCRDCQDLIRDGKTARATRTMDSNQMWVRRPDASHFMGGPRMFGENGPIFGLHTTLNDNLRQALYQLSCLLPKPAMSEDKYVRSDISELLTRKEEGWGTKPDGYGEKVSIDVKVWEALNNLDSAIRLCLVFCHEAGYLRGCELLRTLNDNAISLADFSERHDKAVKEIKDIKAFLVKTGKWSERY